MMTDQRDTPDLNEMILRRYHERASLDSAFMAHRMMVIIDYFTDVFTHSSRQDLEGYLEIARQFQEKASKENVDLEKLRDAVAISTHSRYRGLSTAFYSLDMDVDSQIGNIEAYLLATKE